MGSVWWEGGSGGRVGGGGGDERGEATKSFAFWFISPSRISPSIHLFSTASPHGDKWPTKEAVTCRCLDKWPITEAVADK